MTDTNKMRAEFEVWAESRGLDLYCSRTRLYEDSETMWAWSAWQASRQAVVVELPGQCEYADPQGEYAKGRRIGKRDVVAAIEAQGLRVGVRK